MLALSAGPLYTSILAPNPVAGRRGIFMRRGKTMLWHDNAQPEPARAISWLIEFANDSDVLTAVAKNVGDAHRFGIIDTPSFERLVEEGREKRKEILCLQKD